MHYARACVETSQHSNCAAFCRLFVLCVNKNSCNQQQIILTSKLIELSVCVVCWCHLFWFSQQCLIMPIVRDSELSHEGLGF